MIVALAVETGCGSADSGGPVTGGATTTAPSAATPSAGGSAPSGGVDSAACAAYFQVLDCLGEEMPGAPGESMRKNAAKVRDVLGKKGQAAAKACENAMPATEVLAREHGCAGGAPASSAAPTAPEPPGSNEPSLTVSPEGIVVTGADLHGPPEACAAFHACCDGPMRQGGLEDELGLFCGLAQTGAKGECGLALESVRGFLNEKSRTAPLGCN